MKKKILLTLGGLLVILQLVRPTRNEGTAYSANDITHGANVPVEVKQILETSCFDCHSNHTNYPWYANIQPVGLWIQNHVNEAKEELNFSEFATYSPKRKTKKLQEMAEEIKEHEMPLKSYLWIHKKTALSETQIQTITNWLKSEGISPATESEENEVE
jgi:cytochrome c553